MVKIVDVTNLATPKAIEIEDNARLVIGRDEGSDVVVASNEVSRRHVEISRSRDVIEITDLQSSNGTKLDGTAISKATWRNGQTLEMGPARFVLEVETAELPTVVGHPAENVTSVRPISEESTAWNEGSAAETANNFVARHWRGEASLASTIVVNGLAIGIVYFYAIGTVLPTLASTLFNIWSIGLSFIGSVFLLILPIWQLVGLVRAFNKAQLGSVTRWLVWLVPLFVVLLASLIVLAWIGTVQRLERQSRASTFDAIPVHMLTRHANLSVLDGYIPPSTGQNSRTELATSTSNWFVVAGGNDRSALRE